MCDCQCLYLCVAVECESEDDMPLKYSVILTESQCIARPLRFAATDNTVNILHFSKLLDQSVDLVYKVC